jgi:hypothetical protein
MQNRTMANMAVLFNDRLGARETVHDASVLNVDAGADDQTAKVAAQAGAWPYVTTRADHHVADQHGAWMHESRGINHGHDPVDGIDHERIRQ